MLTLILILLAAALAVLVAATARGLRNIDDILEIVDADGNPIRSPNGA